MNNLTVETLDINTLCINCLYNKGFKKKCPQCGYSEHQYQEHPLYIKPRTILVNQYLIGMPLGQGGFGITYLGQDLWLQKKVAIKEYLPATLATRDVFTLTVIPLKKQENTFNKGLQLFIDEARNLAKFDHPNIVKVINFFEENQTGYMVMDYLESLSLVDILNQAEGRLPVNEALAIVLPILDALSEVHAQHIYHRDISIQNIRLSTSGIPILIDFGAARHIVGEHSRTLDLVLKHGYSPLEQYSGKGRIGPWTDIYACGALLYLMITGVLPAAATDRFCEDNIIAPIACGVTISPTVNDAIMQALQIKHEERFQTVQEFKAALQGTVLVIDNITESPVQTQSQSFNQQHQQNYKKTLTLIVASLFLLGMILAIWSYFREKTLPLKPLFEQAQAQLANDKLTTPRGDNAYETYQQILAIAPNNAHAQAGTLKIAEHYYSLAHVAFEKGDLAESFAMIQQGLKVNPTDADLLAFEQKVKGVIVEQKQAQALASQVNQLLSQAAQLMVESQLEAAIAIYQEVFAIEPDNLLARTGLQQVADKYMQLANTEQESLSQGLSFINKGLVAFPNHQGLLALQTELHDEKLTQQREFEAKRAFKQKIARLLKKAELQVATLRLTTPTNDNAYNTYQQILALAPDNEQAQVGLVKIADQYEQLARTIQDDWQKSLDLIDKGLKVVPTHIGLQTLRQTIVEQMPNLTTSNHPNSQEGTPGSANQIAPPYPQRIENAPESQSIQPSSPPPVEMPLASDNTVQNLLVIAQQHLEKAQYEAASQTYKNILTIEPNNVQATTGLQQIAHRYEQLARFQNQQGHLSESLFLINKGLAAYPTHSGLLALQTFITRRIKEERANETQTPSHIIFTPSF